MRTKLLVLALALFAAGMGAGRAGEKIWVGLYLAENGTPSGDAELASEKMGARLRDVFGFKYYELIKAEEVEASQEWAHNVMPRKDFFIRVQPLPRQPGEPRLIGYEIYKDGFIVVTGKYEAREDKPLFINGPDFKDGRLIFVLQAR